MAQEIWNLVTKWDNFSKYTLGNQLVRSIDSISANIAEGWYKETAKDKTRFYKIARGSLGESRDHLHKAVQRELMLKSQYERLIESASELHKDINGLIKGTLKNLKY